jgi:hypothetical protein
MAKADTNNGFENKDKAEKALEKMKELEKKFKQNLHTVRLTDGTEISSKNKERINDYINSYGRL